MSRESAYELYNRPSAVAFRRAWEAAVDCSIGHLGDLVDEAKLPGGVSEISRADDETSRANNSVHFVNFAENGDGGDETGEPPCPTL